MTGGALETFAGLAILALLGGVFYRRLSASGYSRAAAAGLATLALAQACVALTGRDAWMAPLFAGALYAFGASAIGFAQRQDARSVVLVGGSLAGMQVLYPIGAFMTLMLVPALIGVARRRGDPGRAAGLLALLLFAPFVAALVFAYFSAALHAHAAGLLSAFAPARDTFAGYRPWIAISAWALLGLVPAAGWVFADAARAASSLAVFAIAAALAASLVLMALIGRGRDPREFAVLGAPLCVLAIATWPVSRSRTQAALAACAVSALASWLVAFWAIRG
jgi:hypothetical protein